MMELNSWPSIECQSYCSGDSSCWTASMRYSESRTLGPPSGQATNSDLRLMLRIERYHVRQRIVKSPQLASTAFYTLNEHHNGAWYTFVCRVYFCRLTIVYFVEGSNVVSAVFWLHVWIWMHVWMASYCRHVHGSMHLSPWKDERSREVCPLHEFNK